MGHLSTSDRVTAEMPTPTTTNGGVHLSSNGNSTNTILKRNGTTTHNEPEVCVKSVANGSNGFATSKGNLLNGHNIKNISSDNNNSTSESTWSDPNQPYYKPGYTVHLDEYTRSFRGDSVLGWEFKAPLKWDKVIQIFLLHIAFVVAIFLYPLDKVGFWTVAWSFFTGGVAGFGVTAGAHRFWTHRSYKANIPLRIILMASFSLAGQNTLYDWVRDHRVHHKYSETDADPHNSNRGFFFAHVGWLMMLKHPEVLRRGRQIDMSDVLEDPVVQFHQKYFIPLKLLLCFVLPTLVPIYFWGELWYLAFTTQCIFRYVSSLNFTWSVNSAAHMWGTRPYDKRINPSENIYVSILAMGEGWHNYHHVFPWDYKAAELGKYSVNFTTMVLDFFQKIGWAWNMKQPSKELVRRTLEKYGDGTHESLINNHDNDDEHDHAHSNGHGHCHYPEVPDPELDDAESSSTESSKLDENDNMKDKNMYT